MGSESSYLWTDTAQLTPTGAAFQHAIDNQYVTKDEFIAHPVVIDGLGIDVTSSYYQNGQIDNLLMRASGWINRYCGRRFDIQTIDETYPNVSIRPENPSPITVVLQNAPLRKINSIYVQVLKWFIQFSLEYLISSNPESGTYQIVPLLSTSGGIGTPLPSPLLDKPALGIVWTNYTFGFDTIPMEVKEATILLATKFFAAQRNVTGNDMFATGSMKMTWDINNDPFMNEIKMMLDPYKRLSLRAV